MATQLNSFRKRFEYHFWASAELLSVLSDDDKFAQARGYLAHAFVADWLWLERLNENSPTDVDLFPAQTVSRLEGALRTNRVNVERYLGSVDTDTAQRYTTTTGKVFETDVPDILDHILFHGMYHRGQVARALREAGVSPPSTDYIVWVRGMD